MPILAAFLGNALFSLASFFAKWFTKQIALRLALIAGVLVLTTGFVAGINSLHAGLSAVVIPDFVNIAASWFVPSNLDECVGVVVAAHLARWVYAWNIKIIQYKLV